MVINSGFGENFIIIITIIFINYIMKDYNDVAIRVKIITVITRKGRNNVNMTFI